MGDHNSVEFDVGDLDNDGHLDLVTANNEFNDNTTTVSWILWGNESDAWSTSCCTNLTTVSASHTTIGDFNCDGLLDVAFSSGNSNDACVRVFLNQGNRSFNLYPDIIIPTLYIHGLDSGDLNNDGFDDIVVAEEANHGNSEVFYGGLNGPHRISDAQYPNPRAWDVIAQDLDLDGFLDLAFINQRLDFYEARIFIGGPDGPDSTVDYTLVVGSGVTRIAAGDVNGDGYNDIVVGRIVNPNPKLYLFMGSSFGWSNSDSKILSTSADVWGVEIIDINKDGYDDVITTSNSYSDIRVYYGSALGIDQTEDILLSASSPNAVKVALPKKKVIGATGCFITRAINLPAGKKWDVLVMDAETFSGTSIDVTVLDGNLKPIAGFKELRGLDIDLSVLSNQCIHLKISLISSNKINTPRLHKILIKWMDLNVWRDEFYGLAKLERAIGLEVQDNVLTTAKSTRDFPDILLTNLGLQPDSGTDALIYRSNRGLDYLTMHPLDIITPYGASAVKAKDINGDGFIDIAFAVQKTSDDNYSAESPIFLGSPIGFAPMPSHSFTTLGAKDLLVEDLNLDGYLDVVFAQERNGTDYNVFSTLFWGNADGWNATPDMEFSTSSASCVEGGDIDGDSLMDLIFANYGGASTDALSMVFLQQGARFCGTQPSYVLPTKGARGVAIGDLNKDGRLDLVFANSIDRGFAKTDSYIYLGKAGGGFDSTPARLPTLGAMDVKVADLDNDGDLDIVFANEQDDYGNYSVPSYVYLNPGNGKFPSKPDFQLPTVGANAVSIGDIDGRGKLDLAFACQFDGSSFTVPSRVFLGNDTGWSKSPDIFIPTLCASDVLIGDIVRRDIGGYLSRIIRPLDPFDTGYFDVLKYNARLETGMSGILRIIDSSSWEKLAETSLLSGSNKWHLAGIFKVKEHPSIQIYMSVTGITPTTNFSFDDPWINWTKRVRQPPMVLGTSTSAARVYRTKEIDIAFNLTDEYDLPGELTVEVAQKLNKTTVWTDAFFGRLTFSDGLWRLKFSPSARADIGFYDLRVTVTDSDYITAEPSYLYGFVEVLNNIPTVPGIRLDPGRPVTTDPLRVVITERSTDIEGEGISYHYRWYLDGVIQTGLTGDTLPDPLTSKGQNWSVEVRAYDGWNESLPNTAWKVIQNAPPRIKSIIVPPSFNEDTESLVDLSDAFDDPDGDPLSLSIKTSPVHIDATIDERTWMVRIRPYTDWNGEENITFVASDGELQVEQTILVTVRPVNDPPRFVAVNGRPIEGMEVNLTVMQDEQLIINVTVIDVEQDTIRFATNSSRMTLNTTTGMMMFTPGNGDVGVLKLSLQVFELQHPEQKSNLSFVITILNKNDPMETPKITSPLWNQTFKVEDPIWLNGTCFDPDLVYGETLNFTWSSNITGVLGWGSNVKLILTSPGRHNITLTVRDTEFSKTSSVEITVEAKEVTPPPVKPHKDEDGLRFLVPIIAIALVAIGVLLGLMVLAARRRREAEAAARKIDEESQRRESLEQIHEIVKDAADKLEEYKME